ncbi:Berberine bridge enzyme-like 1 [Linum perenne]
MKNRSTSVLVPFLLLLLVFTAAAAAAGVNSSVYQSFLLCLEKNTPPEDKISDLVYSPANQSFTSVLEAYIRNSRMNTTTTPKPSIIITATKIPHVQAAVICTKAVGFQLKIRSGGHDYEGISYMFNLRSIQIDAVNQSGWVQAGATLGELYWIQSVLWWGLNNDTKNPEALESRVPESVIFGKRKSDYVQNPISKAGLEWIWKKMIETGKTGLVFNPYGGRMDEIGATETPFPHRKGNLWKMQYSIGWKEGGETTEKEFMSQIRRIYSYMTVFVSKNPRRAYLNYRDLDIGTEHPGKDRYEEGKVYGEKYFAENFERLVKVKTAVDPENFFWNEQSIPVLPK